MQANFFAKGKFLITGEYFVLDGAKGLALPTVYGQKMQVETVDADVFSLKWNSYDVAKNCWLQEIFTHQHFKPNFEDRTLNQEAKDLLNILKTAQQLNPNFLNKAQKIEVSTYLDFANNWGLGSSATLIYNIATWAQVNAFQLSDKTFGGSGYDVAVAQAGKPIIFQRQDNEASYQETAFNPLFKEHLFFVHLNQKQNSRQGIEHYKSLSLNKQSVIQELNTLTQQIIAAENLEIFDKLLNQHEDIISKQLQLPKAKDLYFQDYWGSIKSLGAWGGDFILATSRKDEATTKAYFKQKDFETILKYNEIISG